MGIPRVGQENKFITRCFKLQLNKPKSAHVKQKWKAPNLLLVVTGKDMMKLDLHFIE